jgi:F420-dependent oxidoreductase-like protein
MDGEHYTLPLAGGTGLAKPLKSSIHPLREDIPVYLGAEGPKNVALAAELCDGWLALLISPEHQEMFKDALDEGFARPGARRKPEEFEVAASVPFIVSDDVDAAIDMMRPYYALYFGGMGAKKVNFHANVPIRMGYEDVIREIQDLYLGGKKDEAAAKLPKELIDQLSLVGPADRIRERLEAWRESIVTTLLISGDPNTLRQAAEIVLG